MMIPHWFERLGIFSILMIAVFLRLIHLSDTPLGFSQEELAHIQIMEKIQAGSVQVFFPVLPVGGQESLYHVVNGLGLRLWGDGLLGYRLLGVWVTCLGIAIFYQAVRNVFGRGVALVSIGILATNIWALLIARSVSPLGLSYSLILLVFGLWVWTFRLNEPISPLPPRTFRYTLLGFVLSLSIYTHPVGVLLFLLFILFIFYLWQTEQPVSRRVWSSSFFTITLVLILTIPYMISVARNPSQTTWFQIWEARPLNISASFGNLLLGWGAIGWRGDSNPIHNVPALPLFSPVWFLLALGGLYFAMRRWREPAYGMLLLWFAAGWLPSLWTQNAPDFPTMILWHPTLAILAGLGTYYAAQYFQQAGVMGGWRFVALLTTFAFIWTSYQAYQEFLVNWSSRPDTFQAYHSQVGQLAVYLDQHHEQMPVLFCVESLQQRLNADGSIRYSEAQIADYMLHREDFNLRFATCRSAMVLIGGGKPMRVLLSNPRSLNEASPALRFWMNEMVVVETPHLPRGLVFDLQAERIIAEVGGQLQLTSPLIYPESTRQVNLPVRFGRNITLLGYAPISAQIYRPKDVLTFTSYWRVDGEPPVHLGFFTRLHDSPQNSPLTETNAIDVLPAQLQARDIIIQTHFLNIPTDLAEGDYQLTLGVYDNDPLNQIPVFEVEVSEARGNYLIVGGRLTIQP